MNSKLLKIVKIIKANDARIQLHLATIKDKRRTKNDKLVASEEILNLSTQNEELLLAIKKMYPDLSYLDRENIELELAKIQYASIKEGAEIFIFENTIKFLN